MLILGVPVIRSYVWYNKYNCLPVFTYHPALKAVR